VGASGASDTISISNGLVQIGTGSTVSVAGASDQILATATDHLTVNGASDTVAQTSGHNVFSLTGANTALISQAQQLVNAMASFASPDLAALTVAVSNQNNQPVNLAANLH
jgi:hypothetical protein